MNLLGNHLRNISGNGIGIGLGMVCGIVQGMF